MGNKAKMYVDVMSLSNEVTGSCFLCVLKLPNKEVIRFIVDCGLFQEDGYDELNYSFPFNAENIEFALITHNHIDHIGRIPLLYKNGFKGKTYCTNQTKTLMPLALTDTCKILKDVCKRQNRKQIFSDYDVETAIKNFYGVSYNEKISVNPNIDVTFLENGHLIGAAMILVEITYPNEEPITLLFSGDYKNENVFADISELSENLRNKRINLFIESTYAKMETSEIKYEFDEKIINGICNKNSIIIPVFSLGRSQEILLKLKQLQENNLLDEAIPIYFDGNLAHAYTRLMLNNPEIITENMKFLPKNLTFVDASIRENLLETDNCKIILTTSGMGTYGPAQVYLPYFVSKNNVTIIFPGYTAEGTLGRSLIETNQNEVVKIGGLLVKKKAEIISLNEFSGHAKSDELIELIKKFNNLRSVLINHGECETKEIMAAKVIDCVDPPSVGILDRRYFFRVATYGVIKTLPTKFK